MNNEDNYVFNYGLRILEVAMLILQLKQTTTEGNKKSSTRYRRKQGHKAIDLVEIQDTTTNYDKVSSVSTQSSRHITRSSKEDEVNMVEGELQHQTRLISSERPFKILQNETKFIKIDQSVLKISNFKTEIFRKSNRKTENVVFRGFVKTGKQQIV